MIDSDLFSTELVIILLGTSCDFEDDQCGWRNSEGVSHDFDWMRQAGSQVSGSTTGPSDDHSRFVWVLDK